MRLFILLSLFFSLNLTAQNQFFVEYTSSLRAPEKSHQIVLSNNFSFGLKKNKMLFSLGLGREDWFYNSFNDGYIKRPQLYNYHCRTYKLTPKIERQFVIPKSNFSVRLGIGCKLFFLNQIKDSLSLTFSTGYFCIVKPSVISTFNPYETENVINGVNLGDLSDYYYISSVPFALTANFAVQYSFKKWAIKLQYEPTAMRIKTRNAANSNLQKSDFFFYNTIGLGINYPLNFKKKASTVTPLQLIPNF